MQLYICQGDMFQKQIQLLGLFSWRAWGWSTRSKHVALTYITLHIKINVVLLTGVLCLYVITLRDGQLQI